MSGHSKWATTRRQKAVTDAKRAGVFTKISHLITIAAREKGADPKSNFTLRLAIEKAREVSMPKENIERAIKRGTGELEGSVIEEIVYEGYGPGGVAILIDSLTDNRNRSVAEIKHVLTKYGGSFGAANSVAWMFDEKGVLGIKPKHYQETWELAIIEAGAEDILHDTDGVSIITKPEDLSHVKEVLDSMGVTCEFAELDYRPKNTVSLADERQKTALQKLLDDLEDLADVREYYTNLA